MTSFDLRPILKSNSPDYAVRLETLGAELAFVVAAKLSAFKNAVVPSADQALILSAFDIDESVLSFKKKFPLCNSSREVKELDTEFKELSSEVIGIQPLPVALAAKCTAAAIGYLQVRAGLNVLEVGNLPIAHERFTNAHSPMGKAFADDHPLPMMLRTATTLLAALKVVAVPERKKKESKRPATPAQPSPDVTITPSGFFVSFSIPKEVSKGQIVKWLIELTERSELEWAGKTASGSLGKYNNSISDYSVLNPIAQGGPKLYDPDGIYRGRLSKNVIGSESIANVISPFGSTISANSIVNALSGFGSPNMPSSWCTGAWRIVADGS